MLKQGAARKVTAYFGADAQHRGEPLYVAVLNYLFYHGVAGATVTKGVAGFGSHHRMHTSRSLELSENLPVKIEFVEDPAKLETILPKLIEMVTPGLVEVQDTTIISAVPATEDRSKSSRLPHVAIPGKAKLMRIFIGDSDRWGDKSLCDALVESLRANDIAGVTVYRGIAGYGAHRRFHKEKRLSLSRDQPIVLSIVEEEGKLRAYLPILEQMVDEGLVVLSDVDVIKYTHRLERDGEAVQTTSKESAT